MEGVVLHAIISGHGHLHLWFVLRAWGNNLKNGQKESYHSLIATSTVLKDMLKFELEKRAGWVDMDRVISDADLLMCRTCFYAYKKILKAQEVCFTIL